MDQQEQDRTETNGVDAFMLMLAVHGRLFAGQSALQLPKHCFSVSYGKAKILLAK